MTTVLPRSIRRSETLDLLPEAESSGRAASAALPPADHVRSARPGREVGANRRPTSSRLTCDVCGKARTRGERHRLVWESDDPATGLVLADLCRDCATFADQLLELYGGCGRDAISLVQEIRASPPARTQPRVLGYAARGLLYLLIVIASFVLVTLVTSRGR